MKEGKNYLPDATEHLAAESVDMQNPATVYEMGISLTPLSPLCLPSEI